MHKMDPSSKKYRQWWKHLRPFNKRGLSKSQRRLLRAALRDRNDRILRSFGGIDG